MTAATVTLVLIIATLLMITAGIDKTRFAWKRRTPGWWRKRRPPMNGPRVTT